MPASKGSRSADGSALWLALEHPDRVDRLILNTTAGIAWSSEIKEDHAGGRSALAERSLAAIDDPNPDRIRKRLEWLMASPDRVTDELVDVRVAIYSNPEVKPALRTVFEHAFGGIGKPRTQIPEERLPEIAAPTLVLWTDHNPWNGTGRRSEDRRGHPGRAVRVHGRRRPLATVGAPRRARRPGASLPFRRDRPPGLTMQHR